ncbi:HDOD domain-containing protein [Vibrio sp. TH_r3]|uniref:HDOD domain-containing protein n=1 Tax=Vibrio sp. TH_r3 TaxID=3082084 RepID=UPI002954BD16|nr:HDOD domain-containing protein [Vibrio sp. TH_r3]
MEQSDIDTVLSAQGEYCDPVIFEEKQRITENQRVLLQCEKLKVIQRREQIEERQLILDKVVTRVSMKTENLMIERLVSMSVPKLLWSFPAFEHFASFAYSPTLNFSKLGTLTTLSPSLKSNILDLVGNAKFCELLGKMPKHINDPQMAIGIIGIENCRRLFPVLMAKPLLRWADSNTKLIAPKLWQQLIITANVTRMRLAAAGYKEPDEGVLLGVIRSLSQIAICNYFSQIFEDALVSIMKECRESDDMESYFACSEVKPTLSILPNVIYKLDRVLTKNIVEHIEWDPKVSHLRSALLEDASNKPILERSLHGVALGQGRAYAIYDMLQKSSVFVESHTPYWFANAQLDVKALRQLKNSSPGKLTLSM